MARWGKVNFKQLERLQKRMEKLGKADFDKFCEDMAKELAARLLARVIKRTPVADPSKWKKPVQGYVGGTLRRGWTAGSHREAELSTTFGGGLGTKGFTDSLVVTKKGSMYEIEVKNVVEYSAYIEYGHRTANGEGWVPGHFMMTISADEVEQLAPKLIEKKLMKLLGDAFNGD